MFGRLAGYEDMNDADRLGRDPAMRWIVGFAQSRKNTAMQDALATELKDAASGQGNAIKKRDDTHKMAQANRAFAHFRF